MAWPKKKASVVAFKPFMKRNGSGVTRIVRDNYGPNWFTIAASIKKRDGHKCVVCKAPENAKEGIYLEVHHLVPLSRGGRTTPTNLMSLCKRCHDKRHRHLAKSRRS